MNRYNPSSYTHPPAQNNSLPMVLEFQEGGEDAFLAGVVSEVNFNDTPFKLAPTYTLYMASRYRIAPHLYRPNISSNERFKKLTQFLYKVANVVNNTVEVRSSFAML